MHLGGGPRADRTREAVVEEDVVCVADFFGQLAELARHARQLARRELEDVVFGLRGAPGTVVGGALRLGVHRVGLLGQLVTRGSVVEATLGVLHDWGRV